MNMNRTRYGRRKGKRRATVHRRGEGDLGKGRFGSGDLGKGRFGTLVNKPLMSPRAHIKPSILSRMRGTSSFAAKHPSFSRYFPKQLPLQLRGVARRGWRPSLTKKLERFLKSDPVKSSRNKPLPPPSRNIVPSHIINTGARRRGMQSRSINNSISNRFVPFLEKGREQASMSRAMRSGGRFKIGRFGYTTVPNSMERTAPKKGHVNRYLVSSASGNSNRKNPPVSKWNPGPMRLNRIWSQFTPRFGTAAAGSGTLANFHSHFGALGTPMNLYSPYEAEQLTRRNMALGPTMADSTARVAAGTVQRPYVPRHAAQ